MRTLRQDVLYALRQMRLSPIFTLTAMLTLALGIGATTAIFSLINSVMLKSLPVADPASLYRVGEGNDCCVEGGPLNDWGMFPYQLYQRFGVAAPEFEQLAAFQAGGVQFSARRGETGQPAKPLHGEYVSGNYFATFGLPAYAGRTLAPTDDQPSAAPAAMLSHRVWQQEYGSDPKVVGSIFMLDGHPFTIVGITPPGFFGETLRSDPPEIYVPLQQEPLLTGKNSILKQSNSWLRIIGRLRPGAKPDGLGARFTTITRDFLVTDLGAEFPQFLPQINTILPKQFVHVIPAGAGVTAMKADYKNSLRILFAVCCLVLLIACANIANLLLARGSARRAQTAVRLALGASRKRLIRQSMTESLVLSVLGASVPLRALRAHQRDAFAACARLCFRRVAAYRLAVWHGACMVCFAGATRRSAARRQPHHARQLVAVTKGPGRGAGHLVCCFAGGRRAADPEPAEDGEPELRL